MYNKAFLHVKDIVNSTPVTLILFPTNRCNLGCKYCIYYKHGRSDAFNPTDELDISMIEHIISKFHGAGGRAVQISGGGEPTLHPHFDRILRYMNSRELDIGIITNGTNRIDISELGCLKWVRVSVDAANGEIYKDIKGYDKLSSVFTNVSAMVNSKKNGTSIGTSFIICRDNYNDIVEFARLSKIAGANYCRYTYALTPNTINEYSDINDNIIGLLSKAEEYADDTFSVNAQYERLDLMVPTIRDYNRCIHSNLVPVVGADGWLYPCCELSYISKYKIRHIPTDCKFGHDIDARGCPPCDMDSKNRCYNAILDSYTKCKDVNFL